MLYHKDVQAAGLSVSQVGQIGGWACALADWLLDKHEQFAHPTVCRQRKGSVHRSWSGSNGLREQQIAFGYECLFRTFVDGMFEYKSIAHCCWGERPTENGWYAVYALVLHEVAHALQEERYA